MCLAEVRRLLFSDTVPHYNSQVGEESPEMEMPIDFLNCPVHSTDGNAHIECKHDRQILDPTHPSAILVEFSTPTSTGFDVFKALPYPDVRPAVRTSMSGFGREFLLPATPPPMALYTVGSQFCQGI